ncbi:MAG: T9SS type A sorting domain-containing protein [Bacteroidota bacterium]
MKSLLCLALSLCISLNLIAQDPYLFEEENGIVVIEIESTSEIGNWVIDSAISGYTGEHYLHYQGPNYYNAPFNSRLVYQINITTTGTYRFQWRSRIAAGSSNTDHNDSWLRFNDASDFYAQKASNILYPHGSGNSPNPAGAGAGGWFKIYQNVLDDWTWNTSTSDHDPHNIFVQFDSVGVYTFEIAGRSNGHAIDRLVLYHSSANASQALDLSRAESPKNVLFSIEKQIIHLNLYPNPADKFLQLSLPLQTVAEKIEILDINGRSLGRIDVPSPSQSKFQVPVNNLAAGIYFLRIESEQRIYRAKFVKL